MTLRMHDTRMIDSPSVSDEAYRRYVRINLPHARTLIQRIGRSLEALGAFGGCGQSAPCHAAERSPLMRAVGPAPVVGLDPGGQP